MSHKTLAQLNEEALKLFKELKSHDSDLKAKDRIAIPQMDMPAQEPLVRAGNQEEVALGYTKEQVMIEAERCLQCNNAPCVKGCPVGIDIPGFLKSAAKGDFQESIDIIKKSSLLPAVCGRVCPQETQCMEFCTVGRSLKDPMKSVAIGRVERFVADFERENDSVKIPEIKPSTGFKVGVIGSGPAGLAAAADLRKDGHEVEVFEGLHKPGGVMIYGIPEFRLPKDIVKKEIETLKTMGVKFSMNFLVGRTRTIKDLMSKDGFDAIFIGSGAGLPKFMNIPGENLIGVSSANEYLTRANLMRAYDKGNVDTPIYNSKKVAVLGGGNVSMDAARMALRLGADEVNVIYRRTKNEMPARAEEIEHAEEEGIKFHFLTNPVQILGNENGDVTHIECLRYELGEPDDSGRRRPIPIKGSEFLMEMDTVIPALGNGSNPLIKQTTPELEASKWGNIIVDKDNRTSMKGVYAGGDIVLGAATVILAMGEGRTAAKTISDDLKK